ncbi:response regulator transcription factor [Pseudonocardia sp. T1-2H]|jgi:DNA-binding response OmpR family regulator|uniref:response regulator transcription factor n=1 Tax=Pseudonocardia sp. T1-2H TaxID=3128899 RepID=UPI0031012D9B
MRVAVVEDDDGVASAIVDSLGMHQIETARMSRGIDLLGRHREFDVVLLDLGLPDLDGLEVLRSLRKVSTVPVIVLTARDDERTVVRGLRSGADDYLVKPARIAELLARIESVHRRASRVAGTEGPAVRRFGDVEVSLELRTVHVAGEPVSLTPIEFSLLAHLVETPGAAVSRTQLMDRVWGNAFVGTSRTLDVHMAGLRSKLRRREFIETIRGFGFRWTG